MRHPRKPRTDWNPGDSAFRVDDFGNVHEARIRSHPWLTGDHWCVLCDGISGGYLETRFYRRRGDAERAGAKIKAKVRSQP